MLLNYDKRYMYHLYHLSMYADSQTIERNVDDTFYK